MAENTAKSTTFGDQVLPEAVDSFAVDTVVRRSLGNRIRRFAGTGARQPTLRGTMSLAMIRESHRSWFLACIALSSLAAASGCTFRVLGVPAEQLGDSGSPQDGGVDAAPPDLTKVVPDDLTGIDGDGPIVVEEDLLMPDLTGVVQDLTGVQPDLVVVASDMTAPFVPSHVGAAYLDPSAAALGSLTEIDTENLTVRINGGAPDFPPAGTKLVIDDPTGLAVLVVGAFTVDKDVNVIGNRGLVVVASGPVTISAVVRANAVRSAGGPGALTMGDGVGANGEQGCTNRESGGGGAGHGTDGAQGGDALVGLVCQTGGVAGKKYGPLISDFLAGSPGGTGGRRSDDCTTSVGGAGGGAIQVTSTVSVTITATGGINASGGGGSGGCDQPRKTAGGGGGSGGTIFVEGPTIDNAGKLAANGGGGGSGGDNAGGNPGEDGKLGSDQAAGGAANGGNSGAGGAGGAGTASPAKPNNARNAGGGGGAVGYIYLRTRASNPVNTGTISPAATVDASF